MSGWSAFTLNLAVVTYVLPYLLCCNVVHAPMTSLLWFYFHSEMLPSLWYWYATHPSLSTPVRTPISWVVGIHDDKSIMGQLFHLMIMPTWADPCYMGHSIGKPHFCYLCSTADCHIPLSVYHGLHRCMGSTSGRVVVVVCRHRGMVVVARVVIVCRRGGKGGGGCVIDTAGWLSLLSKWCTLW